MVALPFLAEFALAALVMLAAIAVSWIILGIAKLIGNPSVGPVSIPIGRWIGNIAHSVESWAVQHGKQWFGSIANWFTQEWYSIKTTFEHAVASDLHISNQVQHGFTNVLPKRIAEALHRAQVHAGSLRRATDTEIHKAWAKWERAHSIRDAHRYIAEEAHHPSVEHALLALAAQGVLAGEAYTGAQAKALRDYIDGELAKERARTGALAHAVDVTLPAEVAVARTAVKAITDKFEKCAVTRCAGPNQFGNLLNDALGIASAAEIASFIYDVVKHPQSTASTFAGELQTLESGAESLFNTILSL